MYRFPTGSPGYADMCYVVVTNAVPVFDEKVMMRNRIWPTLAA